MQFTLALLSALTATSSALGPLAPRQIEHAAAPLLPRHSEIAAPLNKRHEHHLFKDIIAVSDDVPALPAAMFNDAAIPNLLPSVLETRQEPDPDRNSTIPDYIFLVQCLDAGFRGDCLVFGAAPGTCVSYFDFDSDNTTDISDIYNDKVSSLSSNTGGVCQFYKYAECNNKGDDPGVTLSYLYDTAIATEEPDYSGDYDGQITSWRC